MKEFIAEGDTRNRMTRTAGCNGSCGGQRVNSVTIGQLGVGRCTLLLPLCLPVLRRQSETVPHHEEEKKAPVLHSQRMVLTHRVRGTGDCPPQLGSRAEARREETPRLPAPGPACPSGLLQSHNL
ncbi:unnamed protein product [Rangifer tarandus platyrhynchus]|uniref:Uncharacterized protein n=2 Tax=Rangifer tarandus platyrhynchus TaxID=3082113 RepID=A0AC59Z200_RANTA|nr:unnamed protein product [Rangifer tarandus platyrhynchus]